MGLVRSRPRASFSITYIEPLVRDGDKKAVVIISDALRYEAADELGSRIRQEDRFDATLTPCLACCRATHNWEWQRSYRTPLSSTRRMRRLCSPTTSPQTEPPSAARSLRAWRFAIGAEDFKALSADERRERYKANRVYVYHNRIDATGDKPGTERQVFEAVEDTLRDIVDLVKKFASANATNIFITADHGFLFEDEALADSSSCRLSRKATILTSSTVATSSGTASRSTSHSPRLSLYSSNSTATSR